MEDIPRHEAILLVVATAGTWALVSFGGGEQWALPITILWMWLVITVPICLLYLIGRPVEMNLAPLFPSPAVRAFWRELRCRPAITNEEFYSTYYAGSGISQDIVAGIRDCLVKFVDPEVEKAIPSDNLLWLYDELDFAEFFDDVGRPFGVRFTSKDYPSITGTLDNMIRITHSKVRQRGTP